MLDINNCFTHDGAGGLVQNVNQDEISSNVIDLDAAGLSIVGSNGPYIIIKSIAAGSGGGTIEFQLISSTEAALTGGTSKVIGMWRFADTIMTAGALLVNQQLPIGKYYRYLGINFNIFTTTCAQMLAYLGTPEPAETVVANTVAGS